MAGWDGVLPGFLGALGTGLATGVGALPVLGLGRLTPARQDALLGFAAGVMLAAAFFSLIVPAIDLAERAGHPPLMASSLVMLAVLAGAAGLEGLGRVLPVPGPDAAGTCSEPSLTALHRPAWLLILAITLHNIPEGAAVGMSFVGNGPDHAAGLATAIGIGVQNLPEGLAVSCALVALGQGRLRAFLGGLASGMVEPIAGLAAAVLVSTTRGLLPWGLAAAGGAMLLIVIGQIIPAVAREDRGKGGVAAIFAGLALMLVLDTALG